MSHTETSFRSVGRTDTGRVRKLNEDVFLDRADAGLWAVADGMGGHRKGDVAAARIVYTLGKLDPDADKDVYLMRVRDALTQVNRELFDHGAGVSESQTMGATVAVMFVANEYFSCVWAGDSRVYRIRDGQAEQLTKDHSLVQDLVDSGDLTPDEAESHPMSNVITRAIGADQDIQLDQCEGKVESGDIFFLTTDGLIRVCTSEDIAQALQRGDMDVAADQLLDLSLARGAPDNLSFVIVKAP